MGVGKREFQTYLCDGCGLEIVSEVGSSVDGYYIEVLQVRDGGQLGCEDIFACSDVCLPNAVNGGLRRQALPEAEKISATQELWLRGRQFSTNPSLPILDMRDESRVIGTAREIVVHQPTQPRTPVPRPRPAPTPIDALDPEWKDSQ